MISIVTICPWQYAKWLGECCDSVVNQTKSETLEHIIVTIGFYFGRPKHSMQKEVRLNHDPGLSTCRNIGVAAGKGEYVMMLDADDWLAPDFIEKVTPKLGRASIVCSSLQCFGDRQERWTPPNGLNAGDLKRGNPLFYNSVFHRKAFVWYEQDLDQWGWEDYSLWIRMIDRCCVVAAPDAVLHYRLHSDSHTHRSHQFSEQRSAYFREHYGTR